VDAKLTDFPTVAMRRWELKLPGYSGKVPDPLNWLGTGILASDSTQKIKARVDPTGKTDIELVTNKKLLADGTIQFAIDRRNFTEIPLIIQRTRARTGLLPLDAAHVRFLHLDPILKTRRESSLIDESGGIAREMLQSGQLSPRPR
jgi:hypothetical protein